MNQDQFHYHAVNNPEGYLQAAPHTWNSNNYAISSTLPGWTNANGQTYRVASASHTHQFIPFPPTVVTEPEEEKPPRWSFKSF